MLNFKMKHANIVCYFRAKDVPSAICVAMANDAFELSLQGPNVRINGNLTQVTTNVPL